MITITPTLELPSEIAQGLTSGIYERMGGVIQKVGNKQVVTWLRDAPNVSVNNLETIAGISSSVSILNLGISIMGFASVLHKLQDIEERLQKIQQILEKIDRKIDLGFYANFHAALNLAISAFAMNQSENRKSMAINRFLEAEHVYLKYIDKELDQRSKLVNEYLLTLFLAYTAEIRCYLELEEFDRTVQRLQEGSEKIRSRIRRYVEILLTSNPAVYLHPKFKNQISLSRLTKIYQWIDPSLNESAVFELQRNNLFRSKMDKGSELEYKWVTSLPPAIVSKSEIQGTIWGNIEETKLEAMNRLPQVLETMESMIETIQRFDSFQFEVKAISKLNITFHNWSQLTLAKEQSSENATLMYLIPSNPVQF